MIKYFVILLLLIFPTLANAQVRFNFKFDLTKKEISSQNYRWKGIEGEIEKEFKKNRLGLSGFAVGIRREPSLGFSGFGYRKNVERWDEGSYLIFRTYRKYTAKGLELQPGVTFLYGLPGASLDSSNGNVHVFPLRNVGIPKYSIAEAGLLYPEASLIIRKKFPKERFNMDIPVGFRIMRFGITKSGTYKESTVLLPTVGIRVGIKLF